MVVCLLCLRLGEDISAPCSNCTAALLLMEKRCMKADEKMVLFCDWNIHHGGSNCHDEMLLLGFLQQTSSRQRWRCDKIQCVLKYSQGWEENFWVTLHEWTGSVLIHSNIFAVILFLTILLAPKILVFSPPAWASDWGSLRCSRWFWRCRGSPPEKAQTFSAVQKALHAAWESAIIAYYLSGDCRIVTSGKFSSEELHPKGCKHQH